MKHFIENNIRTIINISIIVVFILPSVIISYLVLFGFNVGDKQASASLSLFIVGFFALVVSKISEI